MGKKNIHVVPNGDEWSVVREGGQRKTRNLPTQTEAIDYASPLAKTDKVELVIHRPNGRIRDKRSYGNDPYPPEG